MRLHTRLETVCESLLHECATHTHHSLSHSYKLCTHSFDSMQQCSLSACHRAIGNRVIICERQSDLSLSPTEKPSFWNSVFVLIYIYISVRFSTSPVLETSTSCKYILCTAAAINTHWTQDNCSKFSILIVLRMNALWYISAKCVSIELARFAIAQRWSKLYMFSFGN